MKKNFKAILSIGILAVAAILVYALARPAVAPKISKIKIGSFSQAIDYAPYLVAKDQGLFVESAKNFGAEVEYTEFQSVPSINEAFASNNIDVVFEAEPPAIIANAAGIDVKIKKAGVSLTQDILVPAKSNFESISSLKGKKIAVLSGSSSHYGVIKILQNNGLKMTDVQIIDMTPPDAKAAFESGKVDAWAVWPPFVQQEIVSGYGRTLSGGDVAIQSIVAVRGGFVNDNQKLSAEILNDINKAQDWIVTHPAEAQEIVARQLKFESNVVALAWPVHNFKPAFGDKEISDIQAKADFLSDMKLIKNHLDVRSHLIDLK